ncbi:FxLYD domain-containing protein [Streptomyces californicus]|uniref:FxLYD domain-containing protein n=1 Tax=Streptomyces californicus TaxID=67351 RepID=UPI0036F138D6
MSQQYPQNQPPQGWGPQQPQWGGPPPAPPKKSNAGKVIGFGCLGAVGLLVAIGIVGAVALGGDDGGEASSKPSVTASKPAAAPEKGAEEEPKEEAPAKAKEPSGPEGDVKVTGCEVEPTMQWPSASLDVTNRSSKPSNYIISVEFVDADGTRVGEGTAALNNLAPGQVSKEKAQGLTQVSGKVECRVTKVTRYAS